MTVAKSQRRAYIYIERREGPGTPAGGFSCKLEPPRRARALASSMRGPSSKKPPSLGEGSQMRLSGAHVYDIDLNAAAVIRSSKRICPSLCNFPAPRPYTRPNMRDRFQALHHLRFSDSPADVARVPCASLFFAVTTILLGACWAALLSRAAASSTQETPRWESHSIYAGYYMPVRVSAGSGSAGVIPLSRVCGLRRLCSPRADLRHVRAALAWFSGVVAISDAGGLFGGVLNVEEVRCPKSVVMKNP